MTDDAERRVAIACQGGGSHTAFTAGVLARLLDADALDGHRIVAFSGTSGGAVCATLAWSAVRAGEPHEARRLLEGFWTDNAASTPAEQVVNAWMVWASTLQSAGLLPSLSPYDVPVTGLDHFRELLDRWVDFDRIDADRLARHPLLLIGAVDVLSGRFRAFHSRREPITADMILASAAVPTVFPAVRTDDGTYWDGLFSQNPPVRELLETAPDELWVVQINPTARATEPRSVLDIADRRNELSGNLSLYQELHVIEKIDQLLADGLLTGDRYKQVTVRVIELARQPSARLLGPASKLNRDRRFLRDLMAQGEHQAEQFLTALAFERAWRGRDTEAVMRLVADDAELTSAAPFTERAPVRGRRVREVLADLPRDARPDLTRKQISADGTAWTVRTGDGTGPGLGRAEAEFRDGRLVRLRLGPAAG
ncbi:MAG TPA: patatin-like phospholipase family protein [Pseudonocardia sp.]|nr:patatin-like phospholipase family protein [Pseudonocardia sp.]